jgi:cell wall-associated NlpC family hydrolase
VRRSIAPLLVVVLLSGCVKRSQPVVEPAGPPVASGAAAASVARSFIGTPYRNGGTDPTGFDCSGFVQYVFREIGVALPRSVGEQAAAGDRVDRRNLREGDVVFFAIDGRSISHVGIVVSGSTFVHAPSSRGRVREESLSVAYWQSKFVAARRFVKH